MTPTRPAVALANAAGLLGTAFLWAVDKVAAVVSADRTICRWSWDMDEGDE